MEEKIKEIFKKVLDIDPSEIKPDEPVGTSLDMDSTELVEISVAIKKELGVPLKDGELKKTHTFKEIVGLVQSRASEGSCGCGCAH